MFFGIHYNEVTKVLRQLSKPVNHGANYLMSWDTLIDSMGLENIFLAAKLTAMPKHWGARQIATHLLSLFANTYKVVANDYPRYIQTTVKAVGHLVNPYGWTRRCFGDPIKNASDKRALVAHLPQSTNGQALNKAAIKVFNNVWKIHSDNFKMNALIHDSLVFQVRIGFEDLILPLIKKEMEDASVVQVTDIGGITRTMNVPVDITSGGKSWQDSKES
jgi:DNA polymerase I-like protein with 3'-5' exonuclease and polymerase domains